MKTWLINPDQPGNSPLIWAAATTFRTRATPTQPPNNTTTHPASHPTP
jgi:hypothetical protein